MSQDKPKTSGPRTLSPGYRDIRPHVPQSQAVSVAQTKQLTTAKLVTANGSGAPVAYQMIPVPVQTSSQPVMMIQSNGGHVSNVIQLPANPVLGTTSLFSANLGRLV